MRFPQIVGEESDSSPSLFWAISFMPRGETSSTEVTARWLVTKIRFPSITGEP